MMRRSIPDAVGCCSSRCSGLCEALDEIFDDEVLVGEDSGSCVLEPSHRWSIWSVALQALQTFCAAAAPWKRSIMASSHETRSLTSYSP